MLVGTVVGQVWATQKETTLEGLRLLVVQPYDKSVIGDIERALQESDLGLNPSSDGNVIRLAFPTLTYSPIRLAPARNLRRCRTAARCRSRPSRNPASWDPTADSPSAGPRPS